MVFISSDTDPSKTDLRDKSLGLSSTIESIIDVSHSLYWPIENAIVRAPEIEMAIPPIVESVYYHPWKLMSDILATFVFVNSKNWPYPFICKSFLTSAICIISILKNLKYSRSRLVKVLCIDSQKVYFFEKQCHPN